MAITSGELAEAETSFGKALEAAFAYGFPYNKACALFEWGEMYLKRNSSHGLKELLKA